jgi:hypothetical protein
MLQPLQQLDHEIAARTFTGNLIAAKLADRDRQQQQRGGGLRERAQQQENKYRTPKIAPACCAGARPLPLAACASCCRALLRLPVGARGCR